MEARPPALIESVVAALIPPAARESVMGDLLERYRSPWAFVAEAARTVPFVLASRIRRTSNFFIMPIVAAFMVSGFGVGLGGGTWRRGLPPTIAALLGYMLRDAYRTPDSMKPWRAGAVDTLLVALFIAASQALVARTEQGSLMTPAGVGIGTALLLGLALLRMQNPGITPPSVFPAAMSLDELRHEIVVYERLVTRAARIELAVGLAILPLFVGMTWLAPGPLMRAGAAAAAAGVLFVVWYIRRSMRDPVPLHLDFRLTVALYRDRLDGHAARLRTIAWWYLAPLFVGPTLIMSERLSASPTPLLSAVGPVVMQAMILTCITAGARHSSRSLRRRIDALDVVEERASI